MNNDLIKAASSSEAIASFFEIGEYSIKTIRVISESFMRCFQVFFAGFEFICKPAGVALYWRYAAGGRTHAEICRGEGQNFLGIGQQTFSADFYKLKEILHLEGDMARYRGHPRLYKALSCHNK